MPENNSNGDTCMFDTGDFDPVEQQMIIDSQKDDQAFKRIVVVELIKGRKRCSRITPVFNKRLNKLEKWKVYLTGAIGTACLLLPVIWYLVNKYAFK
jgi:hypothetical protein